MVNMKELINNIPEMIENSGKVATTIPIGSRELVLPSYASTTSQRENLLNCTPGMMLYGVTPCLGDNPADKISIAFNKIYAWNRHLNSGSRNYDAVDFGVFLLLCDSIAMNMFFLKKLIQSAQQFTVHNRYIFEAFLRGLGISEIHIKQLRNNPLEYAQKYNKLVSKLNGLGLPVVFDYILRHAALMNDFYADRDKDLARAQLYSFYPKTVFKFAYAPDNLPAKALAAPGSGYLQAEASLISNPDDFINQIEEQIDAVLLIEDFGIMVGDTMKSFGPESFVKFDTMSDEDVLSCPDIVFDEDVNSYIRNCCIWDTIKTENMSIIQTKATFETPATLIQAKVDAQIDDVKSIEPQVRLLTSVITSNPTVVKHLRNYWSKINSINILRDIDIDYTPLDTVSALTACTKPTLNGNTPESFVETNGDWFVPLYAKGPEILSDVYMCYYRYESTKSVPTLRRFKVGTILDGRIITQTDSFDYTRNSGLICQLISAFEVHPPIAILETNNSLEDIFCDVSMQIITNPTRIPTLLLGDMKLGVILSLFSIDKNKPASKTFGNSKPSPNKKDGEKK